MYKRVRSGGREENHQMCKRVRSGEREGGGHQMYKGEKLCMSTLLQMILLVVPIFGCSTTGGERLFIYFKRKAVKDS